MRNGVKKEQYDAMDHVVSRFTIKRHLLVSDLALDEYSKQQLQATRGKRWFGFSTATDESPPEAPRYSGLRFQITYVYVLFFEDVSSWEYTCYDAAYPFHRKRYSSYLFTNIMQIFRSVRPWI